MQESSNLPNRLSADQRQQAEVILVRSEIALISCLWWRMDIRDVILPRRLMDSYFFFPAKGRLACRIGGQEYLIGPGQFMMVAEGVEHEAWQPPGCDYLEAYALHAYAYSTQGQPLPGLFASPIGRMEPPAPWFSQLEVLTHLMGADPKLGRQFGDPWLRGLLLQQLSQGNALEEPPAEDDRRLWTALEFIMQHNTDPLTVSALARQAGLSDVQFRKRFRHYTGQSPKAYIQQLRLRKARALLRSNPRLTIKEVAKQTGFMNANYLHAVFKETYDSTPNACRAVSRRNVTD